MHRKEIYLNLNIYVAIYVQCFQFILIIEEVQNQLFFCIFYKSFKSSKLTFIMKKNEETYTQLLGNNLT